MTLVFVYNANSGTVNAALDSMHKIVSPSTYPCKLCELTFGTFTERTEWKEFRINSAYDMRFLHKDEYLEEFGFGWLAEQHLPLALRIDDNGPEVFISSETFNGINSVEALIALVRERLAPY